jgi:uncharacterized repeat protein (TIGR01451 family)
MAHIRSGVGGVGFVLLAFLFFAAPAWAQVTGINKTGPNTVIAGQDFSYQISVSAGATSATGVQVVDNLPTGVDVNSLPANCTDTEVAGDIVVTCNFEEIAANSSESVTLNVEAPDTPSPPDIVNKAVVTGTGFADTVTTTVLCGGCTTRR